MCDDARQPAPSATAFYRPSAVVGVVVDCSGGHLDASLSVCPSIGNSDDIGVSDAAAAVIFGRRGWCEQAMMRGRRRKKKASREEGERARE
jgi:hypothetical protein